MSAAKEAVAAAVREAGALDLDSLHLLLYNHEVHAALSLLELPEGEADAAVSGRAGLGRGWQGWVERFCWQGFTEGEGVA